MGAFFDLPEQFAVYRQCEDVSVENHIGCGINQNQEPVLVLKGLYDGMRKVDRLIR